MRTELLAGVALCLLTLTGCTATVTGTPIADRSAVDAALDTGSFPTSPRTIAAPSEAEGKVLETRRMLEVIPTLSDVDPAMKYMQGMSVVTGDGLASAFGSGVGAALSAMQFGVTVDARDQAPGAKGLDFHELIGGVVRMASEADAAKAVADPRVLGSDGTQFGYTSPPKIPVTVDGFPNAKAFTKTDSGRTRTVALAQHGRFVVVVWSGSAKAGAVQDFLRRQTEALDGFTPTADDRLTTLPPDRDGIETRTLPSKYSAARVPSEYGWSTQRGQLHFMANTDAAAKDFADAGVDLVGMGGSNVYRARDAAGAVLLGDRFITEFKGYYASSEESNVPGVPGSRCLAIKTDSDGFSLCVVAVGRYLAEYQAIQPTEAKQATAAGYLILKKAG